MQSIYSDCEQANHMLSVSVDESDWSVRLGVCVWSAECERDGLSVRMIAWNESDSGDAQSSVTPRPRYVTSHSLIGHKYWNITISQQLHGFSPLFLQIRIYWMHGIHKINNL